MSDVYLDVIRGFNRKRVSFVVIGVSGINYYARDAHQFIMTADFDIFLKPDISNVRKALDVLADMEFVIATSEAPIGRAKEVWVKRVVEKKMSLTCSTPYGHMIDLCLEVSGFDFNEIRHDARVFRAGRTPVYVGSLEKLIRMKEIAARKKDIVFLEKYRLVLAEQAAKQRRKPKNG